MPALFAAAAVASMSAPASDGTRTLMIDAYPIFLISGTAVAFVAPAHATVVSSLAKLVMPSTCGLVTCAASVAPNAAATPNERTDFSPDMGTPWPSIIDRTPGAGRVAPTGTAGLRGECR